VAVSTKANTEESESFEMLLFKGSCKDCGEEIALLDFEKKEVFFRNVVPNFIG
jgi:hypothetical protein